MDRIERLEEKFSEDIKDKINELTEGYNKHRREYIAVLDRIADILDRLRQLGG